MTTVVRITDIIISSGLLDLMSGAGDVKILYVSLSVPKVISVNTIARDFHLFIARIVEVVNHFVRYLNLHGLPPVNKKSLQRKPQAIKG